MSALPHRIRRQRWQVTAPSQEEALSLRKRLRDDLMDVLLPAFERAFDEAGAEGDLIHIPRLSIHIRVSSVDQLTEVLAEEVYRQVQSAIAAKKAAHGDALTGERRGGGGAAGGRPDLVVQGRSGGTRGAVAHLSAKALLAAAPADGASQYSRIAMLIDYLETGSLPWPLAGLDRADALAELKVIAAEVAKRFKLAAELPRLRRDAEAELLRRDRAEEESSSQEALRPPHERARSERAEPISPREPIALSQETRPSSMAIRQEITPDSAEDQEPRRGSMAIHQEITPGSAEDQEAAEERSAGAPARLEEQLASYFRWFQLLSEGEWGDVARGAAAGLPSELGASLLEVILTLASDKASAMSRYARLQCAAAAMVVSRFDLAESAPGDVLIAILARALNLGGSAEPLQVFNLLPGAVSAFFQRWLAAPSRTGSQSSELAPQATAERNQSSEPSLSMDLDGNKSGAERHGEGQDRLSPTPRLPGTVPSSSDRFVPEEAIPSTGSSSSKPDDERASSEPALPIQSFGTTRPRQSTPSFNTDQETSREQRSAEAQAERASKDPFLVGSPLITSPPTSTPPVAPIPTPATQPLSVTTASRDGVMGSLEQPAGGAQNASQGAAFALMQTALSTDREVAERFPLAVSHAGLVLLHPFLPRFFESTGITKSGAADIPTSSLPRAAALLTLLATGEEEAYELELAFIKILIGLGLKPGYPLPIASGLLLPGDRDEVNALLQAVVGYWSALKSTSVQALQASFLQRRGLVREAENGVWLLEVEPASFDMLLRYLPWGIGTIKLPWIRRPIFTNWPIP